MIKIILSLLFVIAILYIFLVILKKLNLKRFGGNKTNPGRLNVIDTLYVDPYTRIILIQKDNEEHLLLLGKNGAQIINNPNTQISL
jgi:flagellar protein FliO/FliZ